MVSNNTRSGLPREVWRWLLGLNLPIPVTNPRRDFQNGENIATILNHYCGRNQTDRKSASKIEISFFNRGTSLKSLEANWDLVRNFLDRPENQGIDMPRDEIEGTIHAKPGCVELLVIRMYQMFTGNPVKTIKGEYSHNFTDDSYQETLPYHARHTASTSIKSNTRLTQFIQNEDINTGKQMNFYALENYLYNKEKHKMEQPERYDLVPTLNDLALRKPSALPPINTEDGKETSTKHKHISVRQ